MGEFRNRKQKVEGPGEGKNSENWRRLCAPQLPALRTSATQV